MDCRQVPRSALQLLQVRGYNNHSILTLGGNDNFVWTSPNTNRFGDSVVFYNETALYWDKVAYSFVAAADGTWYGSTPYDNIGSHDYATVDAIQNNPTKDQPTTGIFEAYLWQGVDPDLEQGPTMEGLLKDQSGLIDEENVEIGFSNKTFQLVGFGIKCSILTATGNATVSASHRTYAFFEHGPVASPSGSDQEIYPVQIQALESLGVYNAYSYEMGMRDGGLYLLEPARYITRGVVPWRSILALFAV